MDINAAVQLVEDFLTKYQAQNPDWRPEEIRVRPSGDDHREIKIWLGFGANESGNLDALKKKPIDALTLAHPDLGFTLAVRAERFSLE